MKMVFIQLDSTFLLPGELNLLPNY